MIAKGTSEFTCNLCKESFHEHCENSPLDLKTALINYNRENSLSIYICSDCSENKYSRYELLKRMSQICSVNKDGLEVLLPILEKRLRKLEIPKSKEIKYKLKYAIDVDQEQLQILQKLKDYAIYTVYDNPVPLTVAGDGACLYNAASKLLYGDESHAMDLKYRAILDLFVNYDKYEQCINENALSIYTKDVILKTNVFEHLLPQDWSDEVDITALASIIGKTIEIVTNGTVDIQKCAESVQFNRTYRPIGRRPHDEEDTKENTIFLIFTKIGN